MKIGFDVSDLCTMRADGTTRYTMELAQRLPKAVAEHEWLYFAPCEAPASLTPGVEEKTPGVFPAGMQWVSSPWPKYWTQSRLPWDLYRYKPDVLFMPIQQIPFVRPKNMKTVAVVHDLAFHIYPEQFTYKDWLLQHVFTAYVARHADKIIAVSQATARDLSKYYGRSKDVYVVHHGVNHEVFQMPNESERQHGWEALQKQYPEIRKPYLLYVGQIQPRKNLIRLVQAFEVLRKRDIDLHLVIAGSHGWLQRSIYRYIDQSPARPHVILPGRIGDDFLPALYQHAEVFTLPSLYEGFGMPILEAMACGCPVVTSNVSSMPEVARLGGGYGGQAGSAAVLIDPFDVESIVGGIQEARIRKKELREAGIIQARKFTWEKTTRETLRVLHSVN